MIKKAKLFVAWLWVIIFNFMTNNAWAEEESAIVWVADTRELSGLWGWLAAMYNEATDTYAIWVIIVTVIVGVALGFGMDVIMKFSGLDLDHRELRE